MCNHTYLDIYARMSRNRRRLAVAIATLTVLVTAVSGFVIYLLIEAFDIAVDFWLLWSLFWLLCLLYAVLRYAVGWKSVMKRVPAMPESSTERRLKDALMSASLASGMVDRIRLYEIPDDDINSFSLSLPDGTFALFLTRGISIRMPESARVAMICHEIAHMQAGDTTIYTLLIRMAGRRTLKRMVEGMPGSGFDPLKHVRALAFLSMLAFLALVAAGNLSAGFGAIFSSPFLFWVFLALLFLFLTSLLPGAVSGSLKLVLDKSREYNADMHAVYLTRDPGAVYAALKLAAEDVLYVILLPACFDALLFCPVVNYSSYQPFRTQPTMAQRMERLREAFPSLRA